MKNRHPAIICRVSLAGLLAWACIAPLARGADPLPTPDYSGDLWTRSTLTGDWGGTRNDLAKRGLTVDLTLSQVGQGVVNGGLHSQWKYGGRGDLNLNLDTGKMGLWPGGFFNLLVQGSYGETLDAGQTGAFMPPSSLLTMPNLETGQVSIAALTYTQFLSENFGIMVGKMATLTETTGDANAFAHGTGAFAFLNTAFSLNPAIALTVPYSTPGAAIILLPTGKPEEFIITLAVMDSEGQANHCNADTIFKGGTSFVAEGRYTTHFFDLTGHQLLGAAYTDRLMVDLDQPVRNFIIPNLPIEQNSGSWAAYYNFDQYLWQPDRNVDRGWGLFGRLGVTDGQANPIHYFASLGVGGKGMLPGRDNDRFGVGSYYIASANNELTDRLRFSDSYGFEAFYEIAIAPSVLLTPDIQVMKPSQEDIDCVTVIGLRLTTKF